MMLNKIRINILRARILCLFNRLHGDMAQQNISRGNALAQIFFLPSNFYLVPHQTKELLYLLKYLHSICLVLCNINWSISWAHFNWNFDARIMNCWYWRWLKRIKNAQFLILAASLPTSILNYGFLSFSARRVKEPPDKGEVSRPNQIRENPCSAKWKIQNRTNMHYKFLFWISFQVLQARDIQEATKYYLWFGNCPPPTNYCSVHARPLIILPMIEERTFPRKVWPL